MAGLRATQWHQHRLQHQARRTLLIVCWTVRNGYMKETMHGIRLALVAVELDSFGWSSQGCPEGGQGGWGFRVSFGKRPFRVSSIGPRVALYSVDMIYCGTVFPTGTGHAGLLPSCFA